MKIKTKSPLFWISYSDLMTSLFFIMLVFFVLSKVQWEIEKQKAREALEEVKKKNEQLAKISTSIKELKVKNFMYDDSTRSFRLKETITFPTSSAEFSPSAKGILITAGNELAREIKALKEKYKEYEVNYTIVLEGMASEDKNVGKGKGNYYQSYERAYEVKNLWDANGVKFEDKTEIQISGTGVNGIGMTKNKSSVENQKVLIHVIPKIGKVDL